MDETIRWLLGSEPYVQYRTRLDLLGQSCDHPDVQRAKEEMLEHPLVQSLISDLCDWPGVAINNHKKADLAVHKLAFLAEIGIAKENPKVGGILQKVTARLSEQGVPEVLLNIPEVFGGTGEDMRAWALCDTPRVVFALLKMGVTGELLDGGIRTLAALARDNGFPCAASPKLGRFKGPGRKSDPCPYATLLMLSALLRTGEQYRSALEAGAERLLTLWERSRKTIRTYSTWERISAS